MSEMVERLAHRLAELDEERGADRRDFSWEEDTTRFAKAQYRAQAAEILRFLLSPTDEMRAAGRDKVLEWLPEGRLRKSVEHQWQVSDEVWAAMVRAAVG